MKDFEIHECEECYALIPYPGCKHNCPEVESVDEGFEECPLELILFLEKLRLMFEWVAGPLEWNGRKSINIENTDFLEYMK